MELWKAISELDITTAIGYLTPLIAFLTAFIEKRTGKNIIGAKWALGILWRIVKFCGRWFLMPWKEQLAMARKKYLPSAEFNEHLEFIRREVTLNGGKSIKDVVNRLDKRDGEKWALMQNFVRQFDVIHLRLDIQDEAVNRMTFRMTPDLACIYISPNFLRYFGYTREDVLGFAWDQIIAENQRETVVAGWQRAVNRKGNYHSEQILIDSDANEKSCFVNGRPVFDEKGELVEFFGTVEIIEEEI